MMTPFAPVEAGLADRPARMRQHVGIDLERACHEALALTCELDTRLALPYQLLLLHAVEHLHAEIAGEVVVANPRAPQRRIFRSRPHPHVAGAGRKPRKTFEHAGDIGVGEAIIAVTALLFLLDQTAGFQFGQMRTRGLRRDAGLMRKLGRGQRVPDISPVSILARAGSPTSEATMAISGPAS